MKKYQVLKPQFRVDECLSEIKECLDVGWSGMGFKTTQFEEEWSKYTGWDYSLFLNSNTSGLHLALEVIKAKKGKEKLTVASPAMTFISTNVVVHHSNADLIMVDCKDDLIIGVEEFEQALGNRRPEDVDVLFYVGIGGNYARLKELSAYCRQHNIALVIDGAHMAGTKPNFNLQQCAEIMVYSFQAVKNLPTGDSGVICFNGESDYMLAKRLSWLGISKSTDMRFNGGNYSWKYTVDEIGWKYNGNAVMASLALVGLKYLDEDNFKRKINRDTYREYLYENTNLREIGHEDHSSNHVIQYDVIRRDELMTYLYGKGIFCGVHYISNSLYPKINTRGQSCPNSERLSDRIISLPNTTDLEREDIKYICFAILEFYDKA